eukprot:TRINITY_DN12252_c0_g1_i1.p1 TRINITY_DN12252_c0_g1~~TRINITY_DN12252_c0_g1_i1.p1  ORF type:complete len:153 (-),score=27.65 TRINITY_DN12252_c0_g1_i1:64-498(-)
MENQTERQVGKGTQAFAQGLITLLQNVVLECDLRIQAVLTSQNDLSKQLDALNTELETFKDVAKVPPLVPYIEKLSSTKQRLATINNTLATIQQRLDRLSREYAPDAGLQPRTTMKIAVTSEGTTKEPGVDLKNVFGGWFSGKK